MVFQPIRSTIHGTCTCFNFVLFTITDVEMIIQLAVCAHTSQNCSNSQNSSVNVNVTIAGKSTQYEVLAPTNFINLTDNCTIPASTILNDSCNNTILVSATAKSCYLNSKSCMEQIANHACIHKMLACITYMI